MTTLIELKNIRRSFTSERGTKVDVLKGIDLTIKSGTFNVIRGESGSGKTTLLKVLGLLDSGFEGSYAFDGQEMRGQPDWWLDEVRSANIGFIFQDGQLFEHLTLKQNIELPLQLQGTAEQRRDAGKRVADLTPTFFNERELYGRETERVDVGGGDAPGLAEDARPFEDDSKGPHKRYLLEELPRVGSGGQRQRAAVMRSIVHEPALILADEPTASLDAPRKEQVLQLLLGLARQGHTVIVVSHDKVFENVGHQYLMDNGRLTYQGEELSHDAVEAPRLEPKFPEEGSKILWGWRPRAAAGVLFRQAVRETFQRWLFLLLILSALVAGVTQISVFSSVITGAEKIVDQAFTQGSRLNRLEIKPRIKDLKEDVRFPVVDKIRGWENVEFVVPRRQTIVRLTNVREEQISYVAMGLHDNDPEYKLLDFLAGGPFTEGVDQLEIIVTASLLPDFFDTEGLNEEGGPTYDDYIGRKLQLLVNRYGSSGKLVKQTPVSLTIVGIILNAEGGRQMYLPNRTQIVFDRVVADRTLKKELPVTEDGLEWTVDKQERLELIKGPWEDKLQVYTTGVREIIPVIKQITDSGYRAQSDIWDFKWALDIQDIAWRIFTPLLILIVAAVTLTVMANIYTSAKLREKEFALWRVLGMRRGDLALLQVAAAIIAILIGSLIGLAVAWAVVDQSRAFLAEQYSKENFDQIFAPVEQFFGMILAGALLVGIVAAVAPALRTARVDPARVLQS